MVIQSKEKNCWSFIKDADYNFFILSILAMLSVLQTKVRYRLLSALSFCALVAAVDETIQLFVSGRSGQVTDVVLDSVGALCGIIVLMSVRSLYFHLKTTNCL